jgi:phospholipid/cholesterol/gamma-HCH transport system ATP-binding protein
MSIRFDDVYKAFGPKQILSGVSFEVKRGQILFILGKSGMGKSVTLKHIIGVLEPDAGKIFVDRYEVTALFNKEHRTFRFTLEFRKHCVWFTHASISRKNWPKPKRSGN